MNEKEVKTRTFRDSLLEKWVLVDFQIENERKSSKNANISWFTIGKVSIGRFSNSKWARRPRNQRSQVILLFDNRSLVDFPIGNERKREFRPAEIRFYLHKEFRAAEIRFSLHKECRAAEIWFYLHKDFQRKIMKKQWSILKIFCARKLCTPKMSPPAMASPSQNPPILLGLKD